MTAATQSSARGTFRTAVTETLKTVGCGLLIALVLRVVLFQPNTIPSSSMEPGVRTGDYLLITKFDYGWSRQSFPFGPPLFHGRFLGRSPARGDIVVFKLPHDPSQLYIKRVIGLPGDRVQVRHGVVFLNGRALPSVPTGMTDDPEAPGVSVFERQETMPNRRPYITYDRGPEREGDDTGVYVVPAGCYFMMGDNRDNSLDSRWPAAVGVGFVPAEDLVGRARFVLLSWRAGSSIFKPWTWVTHLAPQRLFRPLR